jgi:S-adenosylhomocysteine hydrolase
VLVIGYGHCGIGVAGKFKGMGANTLVYDIDPVLLLKAKLDGNCVGEHVPLLKSGVILCNAGHYGFEIDRRGLTAAVDAVCQIKCGIEEFIFGEKSLFLFEQASPLNLTAGDGNPIEIMDLGLGLQACLIDCGTAAWLGLEQLGRKREDIGSIFLTHLHFEHSGGVESAALYGKYVAGRKHYLIVPGPIAHLLWDGVLRGTIENKGEGLTSLADYFELETPEEGETFTLCGGVKAKWFTTNHVTGKFSCGLLIDERIVYTSDMRNDLPLLQKLVAEGAQAILHDCQLSNAQVHADFEAMKAARAWWSAAHSAPCSAPISRETRGWAAPSLR